MEGATLTGMEWLETAMTGVTAMFTNAIELITGNPILSVLFAAGTFVPMGLRLFTKGKRAAIR